MFLSTHAPYAANTSDLADVDVIRLSFLLDRVDRLSAEVSDAGSALRSLIDGRRHDLRLESRGRECRTGERAMLSS